MSKSKLFLLIILQCLLAQVVTGQKKSKEILEDILILKDLQKIVQESYYLTKNWMYIDKKTDTPDKNRLREIHNTEYKKILTNLLKRTDHWSETDKVIFSEIKDLMDIMLAKENYVMDKLASFQNYDDPSVLFEVLSGENDKKIYELSSGISKKISILIDNALLKINFVETDSDLSSKNIKSKQYNSTGFYSLLGLKEFIENNTSRNQCNTGHKRCYYEEKELEQRIIHYLDRNFTMQEINKICQNIEASGKNLVPDMYRLFESIDTITKNYLEEVSQMVEIEKLANIKIEVRINGTLDHILSDKNIPVETKAKALFVDTITKYNSFKFNIITKNKFDSYLLNKSNMSFTQLTKLNEINKYCESQEVPIIQEGDSIQLFFKNYKTKTLTNSSETFGPKYSFVGWYPEINIISIKECGEGCGIDYYDTRNGEELNFFPNRNNINKYFFDCYSDYSYSDDYRVSLILGVECDDLYITRFELDYMFYDNNKSGYSFQISDMNWVGDESLVFRFSQNNSFTKNENSCFILVQVKQKVFE
jgi:DNA-binding transcriptional MerR regulator